MQFANEMDELYVGLIVLRSEPLEIPLGPGSKWPLPITSISEPKLLRELGISRSERIAIQELSSVRGQGTVGLSDEQQMSRAVATLAANPPPEVGRMQERSKTKLLRAYPVGLRFSGRNMSPMYRCWDSNHCPVFSFHPIDPRQVASR